MGKGHKLRHFKNKKQWPIHTETIFFNLVKEMQTKTMAIKQYKITATSLKSIKFIRDKESAIIEKYEETNKK